MNRPAVDLPSCYSVRDLLHDLQSYARMRGATAERWTLAPDDWDSVVAELVRTNRMGAGRPVTQPFRLNRVWILRGAAPSTGH